MVEHVARMELWEMEIKIWSEKLKERVHLEDLGVGRRIMLNLILKETG